ncbi:MAG: hypothetical protein VSS75_029265 [Candidatus Parabeggiatoa sp.]|nr:hypothetical protein [Candidatus Parabeggiatoa sp.]
MHRVSTGCMIPGEWKHAPSERSSIPGAKVLCFNQTLSSQLTADIDY